MALLVKAICERLAGLLALDKPPAEPSELLRLARRKLREAKTDPAAPQIKSAVDRLALNLRLGAFAFAGETVTQEELAEHLKRIRNDYCKGTLRDTLNRFVPRPAGPRTAIIRVPEPIAMHEFEGRPRKRWRCFGGACRTRSTGSMRCWRGRQVQDLSEPVPCGARALKSEPTRARLD